MASALPVLPPAHPRIQIVGSFDELVNTPFAGAVNALCWPRVLPGNFEEIVEQLAVWPGITTLDEERLLGLTLSDAGRVARDILLEDQARLRAHELAPVLDCILGYAHENLSADETGPVATHVQSWHVDTATAIADTYLCTYAGPCSEGLVNEEAARRVDMPETRAELLRDYGGADDEGFAEFLSEHYYDLHFVPLPGARPYLFGRHNLWRIACDYPGSPVLPCIHRAPDTIPGAPARLLLIS